MKNTKNLGVSYAVIAMLFCSSSCPGALVTFKITGTGIHGSTGIGFFTVEDGGGNIYSPGYYGANIYTTCSLTISGIPGPGPSSVTFSGNEQPSGSAFQVSSGGVHHIAPLAWKDYGPPAQHYYRVDSSQPNYPNSLNYESTIIYDNYRPETASDRITWSIATIVSPPPPLTISGTAFGVDISWTTSATTVFLESASSLGEPVAWVSVTNAVEQVGDRSVVSLATTSASQFFRLKSQ